MPRPITNGQVVPSYPTPNLSDVVLVEYRDPRTTDYEVLAYGTAHPDATTYPDHKLAFQAPEEQDFLIKRIYVNDRSDQDAYNYALTYSGGSITHPIIVRAYIVLSADYEATAPGTEDSAFAGATLVEEKLLDTTGTPEIDSLYSKVLKVFETIPGPERTSKRYNERGDLETVIRQVVAAGTAPDADSILTTGSQVTAQDTIKSEREVATVASHSPITSRRLGAGGPLAVTVESVVAPGTTPTGGAGVIMDEIKGRSGSKSDRFVTTVTLPGTARSGTRYNDRGDLETVTEQSVATGTAADADSLLTTSSRVVAEDTVMANREVSAVTAHATIISRRFVAGGVLEVTAEDIVAPTTLPDTGDSIIRSEVRGDTRTKSIRTTVTTYNAAGTTVVGTPWVTTVETLEPEMVELTTWRRVVPAATPIPVVGLSTYTFGEETALNFTGLRRIPTFPAGFTNAGTMESDTAYIVHAEARPIEGSAKKLLIFQTCARPRSRYEFPTISFTFPAALSFTGDGIVPFVNGRVPLGSDGVVWRGHRPGDFTACMITRYSIGDFSGMPEVFRIDAPGAGSVYCQQIDRNTVHSPVQVQRFSDSTIIEEFDGSVPLPDDVPDYLLIRADQRPWRGQFKARTYVVVTEEPDIVDIADGGEFEAPVGGTPLG